MGDKNIDDAEVANGVGSNGENLNGAGVAAIRDRLQANIGRIAVAMMNVPRYRHQSLADLTHLVLDPLVRDKIIMTKAKSSGGTGQAEAIAGFAIWASVSDRVAGKIKEQINTGAFPTRLQTEDWTSGGMIWLLDIIAPNQDLGRAVLASFKSIAGDNPISIHPIVANTVGKEVIEAMKVGPSDGESIQ